MASAATAERTRAGKILRIQPVGIREQHRELDTAIARAEIERTRRTGGDRAGNPAYAVIAGLRAHSDR